MTNEQEHITDEGENFPEVQAPVNSGSVTAGVAVRRRSSHLEPKRISESIVGATNWLSLRTINYTDEEGVERKWDIASRTTKQDNVPDAVVIIPILISREDKTIDTVLVEQYRPPVEKYTLEFPAGIIDKGETADKTALRELLEETGYVGTIDETFQSEELCMSPGLCDETIQIVIVNVDLDDPRNKNPKQQQDEGECITVKRVSLRKGLKKFVESSENGKSMPISLLYTFAIGLEMGAKLRIEE